MRPRNVLRQHFRILRLQVFARDLALGHAGGVPPAPPGVEVVFLDRHERRDWVCRVSTDEDWPQFRAALEHDHDLVLARRGGTTLGWGWVGYETVVLPALGRPLEVPPGGAYLYEAYVRPPYRGCGVGRQLVAARCERARQHGARWAVTHVEAGNAASMRVLTSLGFRHAGSTRFLRAPGVRVWMRNPMPTPAARAGSPPSASILPATR